MTDAAGVIEEANLAATLLVGASTRRLVGHHLSVFLRRPGRQGLMRRLSALHRSQARRGCWELQLALAPGSFEAVALSSPAGPARAVRLFWRLRETTRERRTEELLRKSRRRYRALYLRTLAQRDRLRELTSRCLQAKEAEARRIAQQLHDEAGQLTAAVQLALAEAARGARPPARHGLLRASALLDRLEDRLRQLSHELRPTVLDELGLAPALGFLAEAFTARSGVPVDVRGDLGEGALDPLVATAVYRIVQEALANVARHARAKRVSVTLRRRRAELQCAVRDDGVGIGAEGPARRHNGGLGLVGIRERLLALGGRLEVRSRAGRGTELLVAVPVRNRPCPAGSCSQTTTSSSATA